MQLLIKPVSVQCNMRCSYCFYEDEARKRSQYSYGVMSRETAHRLIDRVYEVQDGYCDFGFQGGEPGLAGLDFYEDFTAYARANKPAGMQISFTLQSNGLELPDALLDCLKRENFLVGISLDGPKGIHDRCRKDRAGEGTFLRILPVIQKLQERGMDFHVLSVLTDQNAMQIEKIYRFFESHSLLRQQYLPCMDSLGTDREPLLHAQVYEEALKKLFDVWFEDYRLGKYAYIRQFENWVGMLKGCEPEACSLRGRCGRQNVVEANGDLYACDFYALEQYRLGNIWEDSFAAIAGRETENPFLKGSVSVRQGQEERCRDCEAFVICRGGCIREYDRNGFRFCRTYRNFYRYAGQRLYWLTSH